MPHESSPTFESGPDGKKEQPEERTETRREFLKKAGTFLGGALASASMAKELHGIARRSHEKGLEKYLFSPEKLAQEVRTLEVEFPKEWQVKVRGRIRNGVAEYLRMQNSGEMKQSAETEVPPWAGFLFGAGAGVLLESMKIAEEKKKLGRPFHEEEVTQQGIGIVNRGGLLGGLGATVTELVKLKEKKAEAGSLQRAAEAVAFDGLLPGHGENAGRSESEKVQSDFRSAANEYLGYASEFLVQKLELRSQVEQWGAATTILLQAWVDKTVTAESEKTTGNPPPGK